MSIAYHLEKQDYSPKNNTKIASLLANELLQKIVFVNFLYVPYNQQCQYTHYIMLADITNMLHIHSKLERRESINKQIPVCMAWWKKRTKQDKMRTCDSYTHFISFFSWSYYYKVVRYLWYLRRPLNLGELLTVIFWSW